MTTVLQDDFNRADVASGGPGAPVVGPTPVQSGTGTFGIQSNQLYAPSASDVRLLYPVGAADNYMRAKVTAVGVDGCMIHRAVDASNFWLIRVSNGSLQGYSCVAGAFSQYINLGAGSVAAGDVLEVFSINHRWYVFRNGLTQWVSWNITFMTTGTQVGFRQASGDTTTKWDDVFVDNDPMSYWSNLGMDVPDTSEAGPTGLVVPPDMHVYKGRDTATLDTVGAP